MFQKHAVPSPPDQYCLLIVDGHDSHLHLNFLDFCLAKKIILYCLPPHSTHLLQQLDAGLFGPLQHYYSGAVDHAIQFGNQGIVTALRTITEARTKIRESN